MSLYGTYIGNNRMFIAPTWGGKLHALADDLSITTALLLEGQLEAGLTNFIFNNIKEGMNVVDVGANIGYFSVVSGIRVGETGRITAYEPNKKLRQILIDNLTMNEIKQIATVHTKGVYSDNGYLAFNVSNRFQGNSSLKEHSETYKKDFKSDIFSKTKIDVVKLDTEDIGDFINFMKIDVEGAEYHVFKGMENRLKDGNIGALSFELNKSMLQDDEKKLYELLKGYEGKYGYALLAPSGATLHTTLENIFKKEYIDNIIMYKMV